MAEGGILMCFDDTLFGEAVRQKRIGDGLTLKDVADEVGLSAFTISRVEYNKYGSGISMATFVALCNWMQVNPARFFVVSKAED